MMNEGSEIDRRIWAAADALRERLGRRPTVAQVREEAKADQGRTTLVMRQWRRHALSEAEARSFPCPEPLRDEFGRMGERMWERALAAAATARDRVVATEQDAERRELEASVSELSVEICALKEHLEAARARERELIDRAARAEERAQEATRREAAAVETKTRTEAERDALRDGHRMLRNAMRGLEEGLGQAADSAERRQAVFSAWTAALERNVRSNLVTVSERAALLEERRALDEALVERLRELRRLAGGARQTPALREEPHATAAA